MRIRRSRGIRVLAVAATAGLLLGGAVTTASAAPTAGLNTPSVPELGTPSLPEVGIPSVPDADLPSAPEADLPSVPEADLPSVPEADLPSVPEAETPSAPEPCGEPNVDVDQSNPVSTTISISFACQAEAELHKIVTASVAGTEILRIDTRTQLAGYAAHATEVTIPKAAVCITDGTTGEQNCLPS